MSGYQADIGEGYWGCLYDESRRNRVLVQASPKALEALNKTGWNQYVIRAMGDQITLSLNGVTSVDYREADPEIARDGKIAVQIHAGGPMEVQFKDILIQALPDPDRRRRDHARLPPADGQDGAGRAEVHGLRARGLRRQARRSRPSCSCTARASAARTASRAPRSASGRRSPATPRTSR